MKDIVIGGLVILAFVAFVVGLISLLMWDYNNDKQAHIEDCKQIAELAYVKEYKADYSSCFLVKDGKIIEVNP